MSDNVLFVLRRECSGYRASTQLGLRGRGQSDWLLGAVFVEGSDCSQSLVSLSIRTVLYLFSWTVVVHA